MSGLGLVSDSCSEQQEHKPELSGEHSAGLKLAVILNSSTYSLDHLWEGCPLLSRTHRCSVRASVNLPSFSKVLQDWFRLPELCPLGEPILTISCL